jgi:hypothetical protein
VRFAASLAALKDCCSDSIWNCCNRHNVIGFTESGDHIVASAYTGDLYTECDLATLGITTSFVDSSDVLTRKAAREIPAEFGKSKIRRIRFEIYFGGSQETESSFIVDIRLHHLIY